MKVGAFRAPRVTSLSTHSRSRHRCRLRECVLRLVTRGARKAPTFINLAVTVYPHFFWDGRAASLEEQALGPIQNPIEMGNTHHAMVETLAGIDGYKPYFAQAFGTTEITKERVAKAIADYERTRMSGNSPWDRWRQKKDENAVSPEVKAGHQLFFDKAGCNQC